ncbi:hypothetical protein E4U43_003819, partial [Claviceps pusilla]
EFNRACARVPERQVGLDYTTTPNRECNHNQDHTMAIAQSQYTVAKQVKIALLRSSISAVN